MVSSNVDSYVYHNSGDALHTILGIYVDNDIICSNQEDYVIDIFAHLENDFKVVNGLCWISNYI